MIIKLNVIQCIADRFPFFINFILFSYYQILSNFDVHVFCFVFGRYLLDQGECAKGEG